MADHTSIEWADSTFNPVIGCQKVSAACDHCYAEAQNNHRKWVDGWGPHSERRRASAALWKGPEKWQREAPAFFAEHGRRRRVFCASLADVFDNQWPDGVRSELYKLVRATPDLDWLFLTKRPQNIVKMSVACGGLPSNVWLGTTCEDQAAANRNVPALLNAKAELGARVAFVSAEPLLGTINFEAMPFAEGDARHKWSALTGQAIMHATATVAGQPDFSVRLEKPLRPKLDWIITGGESGPHARPSHPDWFRQIRDDCAAAGVAYLHKQWGEWAPGENAPSVPTRTERTATWFVDCWSYSRLTPRESAEMHRDDEPDLYWLGKRAAGRLLDGVEHNGFPKIGERP